LAWILAAGQERWIDPAYFTVILAFVFLGVYWTARYIEGASLHPACALVFLLSPATLTSVDRMTVDVALAALCAGFVVYTDRETGAFMWRVILVLAFALLTRETAWILFATYEIFLLVHRRFAEAGFTMTAAVPAIAWHFYVAARAGQSAIPMRPLGWIPAAGFFDRLTHPTVYDLPSAVGALAVALDYAALAGIALAVAIAIRIAVASASGREPATANSYAVFGFALAVVFLRGQGEWGDAFAFGRIFAPLLVLIAMYYMRSSLRSGIWLGLAPTLLVDSRIALNFGKHAQQMIQSWLH
jgi:hypothetical protein